MDTSVRNRLIVFLASLVLAVVFLIPTFFPDKFTDRGSWISRPIGLGLDLSGGVHLVYQVEGDEAVNSQLLTKANSIRADLRELKIPVLKTGLDSKGQLEITLASNRRTEEAKNKIAEAYSDLNFVDSVPDGERIRLVYSVSELNREKIKTQAMARTIETLRNRVDQFGVAEPLIQKVGSDRVMLQMPGVQDIEAVKRVVGSVAKLEFRLIPTVTGTAGQVMMKDRSGVPIAVEDQALMTGDSVDNARVSVESGQVEVMLSLNSEGTRAFRKITTENTGRQLAIILDNTVYSHPSIREPITQGSASISGGFKIEEATQLAIVLRAGALPAPLKAIEERTVGPTLGKESIRSGISAILIGFVAIVLFMIVYYQKSGALAVFSLFINGFLLIAFLSAFGATLTLPGIAGLGLTLGMAVDSNVIVFERIREELRNGAGRDAAVSAGFDRAYSAIMDANMTTLLSAVILYFLGNGPVRGFAVTLSIGVLTTVYCAVFVSRLGFDLLPLRGKKELSI